MNSSLGVKFSGSPKPGSWYLLKNLGRGDAEGDILGQVGVANFVEELDRTSATDRS